MEVVSSSLAPGESRSGSDYWQGSGFVLYRAEERWIFDSLVLNFVGFDGHRAVELEGGIQNDRQQTLNCALSVDLF